VLQDIERIRRRVVQLPPGLRLFLPLSGDGLQPRRNAAETTFGSQFQDSPAVFVIHGRQAACACPQTLRAQSGEFPVQVEIVLVLLGPIDDLRMAEYAVVEVVVAQAETGNNQL
jgi:hypothetical protein